MSIFELFDAAVARRARVPALQFRAAVAGRAYAKRTWAENQPGGGGNSSSLGGTAVERAALERGALERGALEHGVQERDLASGCFGDDAFFVRADALGVADGVSGWRETRDGSPALYSRLFMHYCALKAEADGIVAPSALMEYGHAQTTGIRGSSTVLIATLQDATLRLAHLGDCGLLLVRNGAAAYRTVEQQHAFNFPFQLGAGSRNEPRDAVCAEMPAQSGDIVVLGSDGLFDNLFDEEILAMVQGYVARASLAGTLLSERPVRLADDLVAEARDAALDRRRTTPFERRAIAAEILYEGGKPDDICAVVAVVVDAEDSPDRR